MVHGEHGFLFEPGDIEALTMRLGSLTNGLLRERLGRAAAHRVRERFTVQAMSERFADCIGELLEDADATVAA